MSTDQEGAGGAQPREARRATTGGGNNSATVTTTAPNFVRGAVVPLTFSFKYLNGSLGVAGSAIAVGVVTLLIAAVSLFALRGGETKRG
ncbi:MAG: hypothetical protein KJ015_35355 [Myxococcales bacterium]|nr:hypothetical protein [Myxococcales bacterium]